MEARNQAPRESDCAHLNLLAEPFFLRVNEDTSAFNPPLTRQNISGN
jgi:hypothetical protein